MLISTGLNLFERRYLRNVCLREKGAYLKISEMPSILVQCSLKYRLGFLWN